MRRKPLICLFLAIGMYTANAQETVIWGSEVVDVSSEYSPLEYSAIQALHKPNVLPAGGDNPNAWRPKRESSEEFVMVAFDRPVRARQVAIAESENPGAVTKIYAYDKEYNEYLLFELTPRTVPLKSRLLNLFFETTPYAIHAVKVFIDGASVPGYNSIDAIGISTSNIPINVLINLASGFSESISADKLGKSVNSEFSEHSPIISPDGKRLYFSRKYHPGNVGGIRDNEDIWISELDEKTGKWKPAVNPGPPLNTKGPNFICSIALIDGKEVLILGNRYGKRGRMHAGVSMSGRNGDTFEEPVTLEIENEYNYSQKTDFSLSPTGNVLIMSVERDETYGGRDLYVSFRRGNSWSAPKNIGADINTAGEDFAPFLSQDGRTLYFSSNGISGYGRADIFVALRLDETWEKWSVPENIGPGINTEADDQYFSIPLSGKHIYFARGTGDENTDIFRFHATDLFISDEAPYQPSIGHLLPARSESAFVTIRGKALDIKTNQPLSGAVVMLERLPDGIHVNSVETGETGAFSFTVPTKARYGLSADLDTYLSRNENFDFNKPVKSDTIERNILLTKIETGAAIVINNIFFDFDKDVLTTSSYHELYRILDFLKKGKIRKIEIAGHTDATGDAAYNQELSERRAGAVYDFFRSNGISAGDMTVVGYGERQPKYPNNTAESRSANRRVEFRIIEK